MNCHICGCKTEATICPECGEKLKKPNLYVVVSFGIAVISSLIVYICILSASDYIEIYERLYYVSKYGQAVFVSALIVGIFGLYKVKEYGTGRRFAFAAIAISSIGFFVIMLLDEGYYSFFPDFIPIVSAVAL